MRYVVELTNAETAEVTVEEYDSLAEALQCYYTNLELKQWSNIDVYDDYGHDIGEMIINAKDNALESMLEDTIQFERWIDDNYAASDIWYLNTSGQGYDDVLNEYALCCQKYIDLMNEQDLILDYCEY